MKERIFQIYDGDEVTESMLQQASQLFNDNYGVWNDEAAQKVGKFAKAGKLVSRLIFFSY